MKLLLLLQNFPFFLIKDYKVSICCLPDDTEHVDVCVVSREVNECCSSSSVQPKVVHQFGQYVDARLFGPTQVLIVTRSTVSGQQAPVRGAFDLLLCVVRPAETMILVGETPISADASIKINFNEN